MAEESALVPAHFLVLEVFLLLMLSLEMMYLNFIEEYAHIFNYFDSKVSASLKWVSSSNTFCSPLLSHWWSFLNCIMGNVVFYIIISLGY